MKFMMHLILGLSLFSTLAQADFDSRERDFDYSGQPLESLNLDYKKFETRYRDEQRQDTCYRDETYTDRVCEDRTYYRNECRDEYQNVCRDVTRYRQECHTSPSRQVCSTTPDRQVCSTTPDRQVCSTQPTRQVCRTVNGRRVCSTVGGGRTCRTVPGQRTCRTVPGQRTCRTEPGQRTCRQVPYNDRVCERVARRVCRDVPYTRQECRDVTRTRQVAYSCTRTVRVPYQAVVADFRAEVNIRFTNQSQDRITFRAFLDDFGKVVLNLKDEKRDVVLVTYERQIENGSGSISADFDITFTSVEQYYRPLELGEVDKARIKLSNQQIIFNTANAVDASKLVASISLTDENGQILSGKFNLDDQELFKFNTAANGDTRVIFTPGSHLRSRLENKSYDMHLIIELKENDILNRNIQYRNIEKSFKNLQIIQ